MECKKCGQNLTDNTAIIRGSFKKDEGSINAGAIELEVECMLCGAIHFTFVQTEELILSE